MGGVCAARARSVPPVPAGPFCKAARPRPGPNAEGGAAAQPGKGGKKGSKKALLSKPAAPAPAPAAAPTEAVSAWGGGGQRLAGEVAGCVGGCPACLLVTVSKHHELIFNIALN